MAKKTTKKKPRIKQPPKVVPVEVEKPQRRITRVSQKLHIGKKFTISLIVLLLVAGISFFAYQYMHTRNDLRNAKNPTEAAKSEIQDIVKKVGKYLELPQGESPTMATVSQKEKLQDQPFFEQTENGDKVLIYTKAQRAVLYRPSTKKVIEYAPVNLGNSQQPTTPQQ